jgi:ribose transport system substrate-binding protein
MAPRLVTFAVALALCALWAAGCGGDAGPPGTKPDEKAPKGKVVIGVSLLTLANPFFKDIERAMREACAERGYELIVTAGELDPAKQKNQVDDFIVKKVSAIVLCPCDSKSIGTSIRQANEAGIPVFTADIACLAKDAKVVCHIATDNLGGGRLAAKAVLEATGGTGKVAIIDHPIVESCILRMKGFTEEIEKANAGGARIQIVGRWPGMGAKDESFRKAEDILQAHGDLKAIFACNDPTALGAIAAIEKAGKSGSVLVVGFDGMPEGKQAIRDGKMYADPIQFPDRIGRQTIEAVARYLAGEELPKEILIPTSLYKKADAESDPALGKKGA